MAHGLVNDGIILTPGSSTVTKLLMGTFALDPPNVVATLTADSTVTVSGLDVASNWNVHVQPLTALTAGLSVANAWVSADNTISVRFANVTILAINQGSTNFSYMAIK